MKKTRILNFGITVAVILACILAFGADVKNNMRLGLDLQGGFEILYAIEPLDGTDLPDMAAVAQSINKRIDVLGVNEPEIMIEGEDRIRVQLAGVSDVEQARRVISSTANLTFRDVDDNLLMDATVLEEGGASVSADEYGRPSVNLKLKDSNKFYEVTKAVAAKGEGKNLMVAWLDFDEATDSYAAESQKENPRFISAASVKSGINGSSAIISGNFTEDEARELKDLINSGSLPVKMIEQYSDAVTADFGVDAFSKTMMAGTVGVLIAMLFMILVYRLPGIISAITIATYVFIVFLIYNAMGGVFSLSGIAALVLGVGMAVDSNIITFERIKDGLLSGRTVKTAFYEGTSKSFVTILDSQVTTFISALILYLLGSGKVRGFATMLIVSTIATLFLIVFVSKFLLGQLIESGKLDDKRSWFGVKDSDVPNLAKGEERFKFGKIYNFDFVKNAKYAVSISLVVFVCAIGSMVVNTASGNGFMNLGIDFTSGTKLTIQSDTSIDQDTLQADLSKLGVQVDDLKVNGENSDKAVVFSKTPISKEQLDSVKAGLYPTYGDNISDNTVTPIIGRELVRNAFFVSILAWIGIMIYISIRFRWDYAISGIIALVHDVLFILAICTIFRLEVNTDIVAVLLAIIGYSINNSIVVFDRIRENVNARRLEKLTPAVYKDIVNDALRNTFTRSLLSSITTMIPVLCLLVLGSEAIFTFNTALLIGLIAGTSSSMFIAAQLWYCIRIKQKPKNKKKKVELKEDVEELIIPGMNDYR